MTGTEPLATALVLTTFGVLLALSIIFSRAAERVAVPVALAFLLIGVLAGSEGIGRIAFEDYGLAFRLGTVALILILFDGGLHTPADAVREVAKPAGVLATIGVLGTTALIAVAAHALGFGWPEALVLGAVVSSTDAAAVFSILGGSGLHLKRRVGVTLEVESGINDPVAVMLTTALTAQLVSGGRASPWSLTLQAATEMIVGCAIGVAFGYGGRLLLRRVKLPGGGLYPALTLAIGFLSPSSLARSSSGSVSCRSAIELPRSRTSVGWGFAVQCPSSSQRFLCSPARQERHASSMWCSSSSW